MASAARSQSIRRKEPVLVVQESVAAATGAVRMHTVPARVVCTDIRLTFTAITATVTAVAMLLVV